MLFLFFDEQKQLNAIKQTISDKKEHSDLKMIASVDCFQNKIEKLSKLHQWKESNSFKIYAMYDLPHSFCGILWRCLFLVIIMGNVWLCIETIWTAPVRYDIEGLAGWACDDNMRSYTIIETANLLPSSTDEITAAWFCVVQYYVTVIVAPILISVILVCVWILPMNYTIHNIICHLLYPLQAWNALDGMFVCLCIEYYYYLFIQCLWLERLQRALNWMRYRNGY